MEKTNRKDSKKKIPFFDKKEVWLLSFYLLLGWILGAVPYSIFGSNNYLGRLALLLFVQFNIYAFYILYIKLHRAEKGAA